MGRGYAAAKARRQSAGAAAAGQGALSENDANSRTQVPLNRYDPNGRDKETIDLLVRNTPFDSALDAKFGYDPTGRDKENLKLLMAQDTPWDKMTNKEFREVTDTAFSRLAYASKFDGLLNMNPKGSEKKTRNMAYDRSLKLEGISMRLADVRADVLLSRKNPEVDRTPVDRKSFVKALMTAGDAAVRLRLMAEKPYRFTNTELKKIYKDGTASFKQAAALTRRFYRVRTKIANKQIRERYRQDREEVKRMSPEERRRYDFLVNDKPMPLRTITLSSGRRI